MSATRFQIILQNGSSICLDGQPNPDGEGTFGFKFKTTHSLGVCLVSPEVVIPAGQIAAIIKDDVMWFPAGVDPDDVFTVRDGFSLGANL